MSQPNVPVRNEPPRVFISYSWKDKTLARTLEEKLRAAGAEVWVDHRGIRGGDNLPAEISNALRWCNTLLLIWSISASDSYWVELEWTNALSLRKKIIPCLLDNTPLPPILSHKAYIEMTDVAEGTAQLLQALEWVTPRPETGEQLKQIAEQHRVIEDRINADLKKLTKQPRGLVPLFVFELSERLSYYGMRAVLVLYITSTLEAGGLGFDRNHYLFVYFIFSLSIYITTLLGGLFADYVLGARRAILAGGILGTLGYLTLVPQSSFTFYLGLALIVLGTGLVKPNVPVMVGRLYSATDPRRDGGFCLYYMSVNIGAFVGPLLCGMLVYSDSFKGLLNSLGFTTVKTWFFGFAMASLGLAIGTTVFSLSKRHTADAGNRITEGQAHRELAMSPPLTVKDWKRITVILILFVFAVIYWWAYEQGEGLLLGAETDQSDVVPIRFSDVLSSRWKSGLFSLLIIIFAPLVSILWIKLRDRQPSSLGKFTLGLLITSGAHLLLIPALSLTAMGKINQIWFMSVYVLEVIGELCVVPTTLSLITRIAPHKLAGTMVGLWSITIMIGSMLTGRVGSEFFATNDSWAAVNLYGVVAAILLALALTMVAITPTIKRLIGNA